MANDVTRTDRLRDRGSVDQWGFILFSTLGFFGIVGAKSFQIEAVWVAVGAIVAMLLYAVLIARSGTGRLRADQAGDNCYYLGLIYTLASLSYAIGTFDPNDTATTIVQGFGIALATTIFGLILRVFFSQGRPDLENVEEQARLELTGAVAELRSELSVIVRDINDFGRQVQQSMTELHNSTKASIARFSEESIVSLQSVVRTAASSIGDESKQLADRSSRYSAAIDELIERLQLHGEVVGRMASEQESIALAAATTASTADSAKRAVDEVLASSKSTREAAEGVEAAMSRISTLVQKLDATADALLSSVQEMKSETDRRIREVGTAPADAIARALSVMSAAAKGLERQVLQIEQLHDQARSNIVTVGEATVQAARRHNDQLEAELGRSRAIVERVHSALADMTESLATRLERGG